MSNKERIIQILKEASAGFTYNEIITHYRKEFNEELLSGYEYLRKLRKDNIIESYNSAKTKGKVLTYRLIASEQKKEDDNLEFVKGLFEKDALKVYSDKVSKDDIERLKVL